MWVFFSSFLLWELVHKKIIKVAFSNRGLVVILASLMSSSVSANVDNGLKENGLGKRNI